MPYLAALNPATSGRGQHPSSVHSGYAMIVFFLYRKAWFASAAIGYSACRPVAASDIDPFRDIKKNRMLLSLH
jgi:hypothetical protein